MGKRQPTFWAIGLLCIGVGIYFYWVHLSPRRESLQVLQRFEASLNRNSSDALLDLIVLPAAVQGRTRPEQAEFIRKALQGEISPDGLDDLKKNGQFGPLKKLFPIEFERWACQAGVSPDGCVAFKLERNGIRTEVVLFRDADIYRVVRCNNVNQQVATK